MKTCVAALGLLVPSLVLAQPKAQILSDNGA